MASWMSKSAAITCGLPEVDSEISFGLSLRISGRHIILLENIASEGGGIEKRRAQHRKGFEKRF